MIYVTDVTTPANTTPLVEVRTVLRVSRGIVYRVEFDFPAGAVGLHHAYVTDGLFQVWPSTPQTTFHADDYVISYDDLYPKLSLPSEFVLHTYNLDDTYEHTLQLRVGIITDERLWAKLLPGLNLSGNDAIAGDVVAGSGLNVLEADAEFALVSSLLAET